MNRYFLNISYDGTAYHGWQNQPNAVTVQQVINEKLRILLQSPNLDTVGCGRTDTGVHAMDFWLHFDTDQTLNHGIVKRLNAFLPEDISASRILVVQPKAHARFDCTEREYVYRIHTRKNPFLRNGSWYVHQELDVEKMNDVSRHLVGRKDFTCFSKSNTQVKTSICDVRVAYWEQTGTTLVFTIRANRFLRNMVRAIVGTLVLVGKNKMTEDDFVTLLHGGNRSDAGESVPACGLFLNKVIYPFTGEGNVLA